MILSRCLTCAPRRALAVLLALLSFFALDLNVAYADGAPAASLQRAAKLLDDWQLEDAMGIAAQALMQNPTSPHARAFAAEVMHQRGQHEEALALLGEGRLVAPDGADHLARHGDSLAPGGRLPHFLPQLRGSARYAATFQTLPTRHFRIRYQDKDELMAFYAQEVLEAAYARIGSDLDAHVSEGDEPITVEIYPDVAGLAQATGLTVQEIETSGTIAVCKFHRLMVISALATATGYAWADTLAHELTHLMVSKRSRNTVPIWLHEGIAKYYETRWRDRAGIGLSAYGESALGRAVKDKALIPFARMHPSMAKLPNQHDAALAFAEVFSMVQMLVEQRGSDVIAKALAQLGSGTPLDTVLERTFGGSIEVLEQRLHGALKKKRFRTAYAEANALSLTPMGSDPGGASGAADLAAQLPEEAHAEAKRMLRLGELLSLRGHTTAAIDPLERAYAQVGVRLPQLGLRLAQALHAAQQTARAKEIVAKTVQAYPDLTEAQNLYASLLLPHEPRKAIAPLRASCLHNPFNPDVHRMWAQALEALGDGDGQAREARFAQLCQAPRAVAAVPPAPQGAGRARLITAPWGTVRIDAEPHPWATPAWDLPLAPGSHRLRATASHQGTPVAGEGTVDVAAGGASLWAMPLSAGAAAAQSP